MSHSVGVIYDFQAFCAGLLALPGPWRTYLISHLSIVGALLGEWWSSAQNTSDVSHVCVCVCVCFAAGPLTIQETLTYVGGAAACTTGLVTGSILLALLRRRCRQKGKLETVFSLFSSFMWFGARQWNHNFSSSCLKTFALKENNARLSGFENQLPSE